MFIGHFAVGFAAKKYAPSISLGWLFIAVQFLDLIWPTLPAPTDVKALAWAAQMMWIFVALAFWADRNRRAIILHPVL
jgi:hypothetical protein